MIATPVRFDLVALAAALSLLGGCEGKESGAGGEAEKSTEPKPGAVTEAPATLPGEEESAAPPAEKAGAGASEAHLDLEVLEFSAAALAPAMKHEGEVVGGLRWRDHRGENFVVFSSLTRGDEERESASAYLFANHYAQADGKSELLRTVRDKMEDCGHDMTAEFVGESFGVTDLDRDGIGEATFAYRLACRSDVSPATLKLLLLEGGEKHILRGETRVDLYGEGFAGGAMKVDPSFEKGPPAFRQHAEAVWSRVVDERL